MHVTIIVSVLIFSIGTAALVLYAYLLSTSRSELVKSFLVLQSLIVVCTFLNLLSFYGQENLRNLPAFSTVGIVVNYAWAGLFFYYYGSFFFNMTGTHFDAARKRWLLLASWALVGSAIVPFRLGLQHLDVRTVIDQENYLVLVPSGLVIIAISIVTVLTRYRKMERPELRRLAKLDLVLKAVLVPAMIASYVLCRDDRQSQNLWVYAIRNVYFLAWNVVSILYAMGIMGAKPDVARTEVSHNTGARALGTRIRQLEVEMAERENLVIEARRIAAYMAEKKPWMDEELTLNSLADSLFISRNRLSHIINAVFEANFADFVNGYRVREAQRLLESSGKSKLEIALESGFASKTTFYAAFKRQTGMNPGEFVEKSAESSRA